MRAELNELSLRRFADLLNRWRVSRRVDELCTALAAIEAAMLRGETDAAELMARAIGAVTGIPVTIEGQRAWSTSHWH